MSAAPTEEAAAKEAPPVQPEAAQEAADLFGGLKKKSKKKKTPADIDLGEVRVVWASTTGETLGGGVHQTLTSRQRARSLRARIKAKLQKKRAQML